MRASSQPYTGGGSGVHEQRGPSRRRRCLRRRCRSRGWCSGRIRGRRREEAEEATPMAHIWDSGLGRSHAVKKRRWWELTKTSCLFRPRPCRLLRIAGPAFRLADPASWVGARPDNHTHPVWGGQCCGADHPVPTTRGLDRSYSVSSPNSRSSHSGVSVPSELFQAVSALVAREDRIPDRRVFQGFGGDRFRTALTRACTAAAVPAFSPHDLRHRRISLLHLGGVPWARIGEHVGQRSFG
jgi:hypothetical protein